MKQEYLTDNNSVVEDPYRNVARRKPRTQPLNTPVLAPKLNTPVEPPELPDDVGESFHLLFKKPIKMKLIGADRLKEIDIHAVDMTRELEKIFTKYETFFEMNRLGKTDSEDEEEVETKEHKRMKANVLRQYIGDAALEAIWPDPTDRTETYEELREASWKNSNRRLARL